MSVSITCCARTSPATTTRMNKPQAVLFDLDGTLLDTAPDMLAALEQLAEENQRPYRIDYQRQKHLITRGAQSLIKAVFGQIDTHQLAALRQRYLQLYRRRLGTKTRLFDGVGMLLENLQQRGISWGIVTNKPGWLCTPLIQSIPELAAAQVLVAGDTLDVAKPHPKPLLHAASALACIPEHCVYVGDAHTDMLAATAAAMPAAVALWGYLDDNDQPSAWRATLLEHPGDLLTWL